MNEADWRTVGYIGVALGVSFLIGGFIAYYFPQYYNIFGYEFAVYPYRGYSGGLFVTGFALAVIGGGSWWRADTEKQKNAYGTKPTIPSPPEFTQSVPRKYCPFCGAENKSDNVFCGKCGKRIT
jgi:hypothetical protein